MYTDIKVSKTKQESPIYLGPYDGLIFEYEINVKVETDENGFGRVYHGIIKRINGLKFRASFQDIECKESTLYILRKEAIRLIKQKEDTSAQICCY